MMQPKTQLIFIYITLICLLLTLGLLYQKQLMWLALPFVLIVAHSSIDIWFPKSPFASKSPEIIEAPDDESTIYYLDDEANESSVQSAETSMPSFENYQHIKKALESHQEKFPHAEVHPNKYLK
ncbi:hypothetical protein MHM98_11850 [Psychrobium sp. MM17-31]|uniref:hypothetical protein n=1 Tax=Psychrobium sp. MM17-31 TaxID=2917758 RepID=UPI001EF742D3|nr:hypothetical protein [Psychrobium sp. MM17-31]MCG7532029.1 hypothetical protein [Psychrobium sp. MM17-31]